MLRDVIIEKSGRESNLNGCLNFIAGEHPEFYSGLFEGDDCLFYIFLKFVFDGGRSYKHHVYLDLGTDVHDELFTVLHRGERSLILDIPNVVFPLADVLLREHECAKTLF